MTPDPRRVVYGVELDVSEENKVLYESFEVDDAAYWRIRDTGSGILLMVPRTRYLF